jgi:hypothetical protein
MLKFGALIFAAAVAASAPTQFSQKTPRELASNPTSAADAYQRGTDAAPVSVKLVNTGKSNAEVAQDRQREVQKTALETWESEWNIKLTFGLVLVGLIQAIAVAYTAFVSNKAANAARVSAAAVVSQLRAYTSIKVTEGMPPRFDPETGPWVALTIRNNGQTPAYEMVQWLRIAVGPLNHEGELPGAEDDVPPHPMTLAPATEIQIVSEGPVPAPGVAAAFAQGQMAAYVYGEINFVDAFKISRYHRFRYTYTITDIQGGVMGLRLSRVGNEAN